MERPLEEIGIYVHIPFCVSKCLYCDFLSGKSDYDERKLYTAAIVKEIDNFNIPWNEYKVKTLFFGGGTPSLLETELFDDIVTSLIKKFSFKKNIEFIVECNPGTVSKDKVDFYMQSGVNRISFGLQSANDKELERLGRIHKFRDFERSFDLVFNSGIENINADIMSSLPCQTVSDYKRTLQKVLEFPIRHISSYSLIIEEGTPFYIMNEKGTLKLPDEDEERDMYYMTETLLNEKGFNRYEISNYALPGYECEHNKIYWQRGNYIGFGAGAASLMDDIRYSNVRDVKKYIENPCGYDGIEKLSLNDRMAEYMFLGMRMMSGVSMSMFRQLFGTDMMNVYREPIDKHIKEGLLYMGNDRLRLTKKGIDLSNYVFCDFLVG